MSVILRLSNGTQQSLEVPNLDISVSDFKNMAAPVINIPAEQQRVVLKGKVLKDTDVLSAVGMEHGYAIHIVQGKPPATTSSATTAPATTTATPATVSAGESSSATPQSEAPSNPYAALAAGLAGSAPMGASPFNNPAAGATGNLWMNTGFGAGWTPSPEQAMEMMQNPMVSQFVQQAMRDPQFMQQMTQNSPLLQGMSPEMVQQGMQMMNNPQMMNQMMSMYASQSQQATNQVPGTGSPGGFPNFMAPAQPVADPRVAYREQLQQLKDMGFPSEEANLVALQQTQGSVDFAIERLLNG